MLWILTSHWNTSQVWTIKQVKYIRSQVSAVIFTKLTWGDFTESTWKVSNVSFYWFLPTYVLCFFNSCEKPIVNMSVHIFKTTTWKSKESRYLLMLDASLSFCCFESRIHHAFITLSLTPFAVEFSVKHLDKPHCWGSTWFSQHWIISIFIKAKWVLFEGKWNMWIRILW